MVNRIHGGGYGAGNGQEDLSTIINTNANGFVGVAIQYRVSATGQLSTYESCQDQQLMGGLLLTLIEEDVCA